MLRILIYAVVLLFIVVIVMAGEMYMLKMPGHSFHGALPSLTSPEAVIKENLQKHIHYLAGEIGQRNMWHYKNLQEAAQYIEKIFKKLGYEVILQHYTVLGKQARNISIEIKGKTKPDEIIVIGAHYDSVQGSPGADDNASGVAAILELARLLAKKSFARTVRFVAFVNEEPPFFYFKKMGSYVYAKNLKQQKKNVVAMVSIESIGYYSNEKNSQKYPFPFSFFYPNQGNFIAFISNLKSRFLVHKVIASFRQHTKFPSEGAAVPSWIPGVSWSDQLSFWRQGYKAIMVTDTALFRNPNYHTATDTSATIDYDKTARVVSGLHAVVVDLAK